MRDGTQTRDPRALMQVGVQGPHLILGLSLLANHWAPV